MVVTTSEPSARTEQAEFSRLTWAFVISIALHLLIFGTWHAGNEFGWWKQLHWPSWLKRPALLTQMLPKPKQDAEKQIEIPLVFVDVSQAQVSPEPPKEAKFYSDKDSVAANPEPVTDTTVPKVDGQQADIVKAEDIPREIRVPLQPTPPPPLPPSPPEEPKEQPKPAAEELKPTPPPEPGDLALAKPDPNPTEQKEPAKDAQSRPRTIAEARARQMVTEVPGKKMKQEGGVRRELNITSFNVRATETGVYDAELVEAVRSCWFGLLDQQLYASDYRGKVVLQFQLHYDGDVTDLRIVENTAGPIPGLLCETAIDKPKPFEKFPPSMRRMVGDRREIQFTFFYH